MTRVAVLFPPLSVARDFIDYPYFADLGAVQAAALLRSAGHEVQLLDSFALPGAGLEPEPGDRVRLGAPVEALLAALRPFDVAVVGYTPFHRPPRRDALLGALLAALRARAPDAALVLADLYQSGQHVVDASSAEVLASYPEVDVLQRYEAEGVLEALVERLSSARPSRPEVVVGHEREPLDELPLPAWDLVDTEALFRFHEAVVSRLGRGAWAFPIDGRSLPMVSTRGCPFRCTHCSSTAGLPAGAPKRQRRHSPGWLGRLLDLMVARGARRVHLLDELANVNERHFDALLELLAERGLAFEIPNGVRADYVLDRHLERMRGRLTTLSVSAETGVQRVADEVVGKSLDLEAIHDVAARAEAHGVPLLVHFMIGLPGETREEINQTLEVALDLWEKHHAYPAIQFATPLPGTRLAREAASRGARSLPLADDWGPRFQREPSLETAAVTRQDLLEMKETFELRLAASQGPKKIILNATYKCNNRCTFCAVGTRSQFDGDFTRQLELLEKYRAQGVTLLDIDGGEPTLNPNLFRLIRAARRLGYRQVNVTTNGRLAAYRDFAERLIGSGVTSLLFSLHGHNRWLHAANVGVPEAFDQTLEGLKNCRELAAGRVELGVNVTLTLSNHRHVLEIAELVHALGVTWLNVQFLTPFGRATRTVAPDTAEAARHVMRTIDVFGDRMKICVINVPWCFFPGYERHVMGDLLKLERHMLFVNNEEVNLFDYLRQQRQYEPGCAGCTRRSFCGGFYRLDDVEEPTWLIQPEDLVRPIAREGLTGPARREAAHAGAPRRAE